MRLKEGFQLRDICGNKALIATGKENIDFNKMLALNETAAELWEEASKGDFNETSLATFLCTQYDISEELALEDVKNIISEWKRLNLIEST